MKYKTYKAFPLVVETKYLDVCGVHPLMQEACAKLCEMFSTEPDMALGVFGSSVTSKCNQLSDLDLVIRLRTDDLQRFYSLRKRISLANLGVETDVIYFNELENGERLKEEIQNTVYPLIDNLSIK